MIFYILLAVLIISFTGLAIVNHYTQDPSSETSKKFTTSAINSQTYNLEIASTPLSRQKGLMNRAKLDQNSGMLFVFESTSIYPFWMKNTLIPLDIIWLNDKKEVVYIKENAQPCENTIQAICQSIVPLKPALYVVELNAGEVQKLDLKVGDKIDFEL